MIRLRKTYPAPKSLKAKTSYNGEDVIGQLMEDHHHKCYLCEKTVTTDFQVEHHCSVDGCAAKAYAWSNLLLACSYCNGKKGNRFDHILHPCNNNIEDLISIIPDFSRKKVQITSSCDLSGISDTILLLDRIHNGTVCGMRTIREDEFYRLFRKEIHDFIKALREYKEKEDSQALSALKEYLCMDRQFLGAKFSILKKDAPDILNKLTKTVKWNRK